MTNSNALLYMDLDVRIVSLWPCLAPTSAGAELDMEQEKQQQRKDEELCYI